MQYARISPRSDRSCGMRHSTTLLTRVRLFYVMHLTFDERCTCTIRALTTMPCFERPCYKIYPFTAKEPPDTGPR